MMQMRKAAGYVLVSMGAAELALYGIVMLRVRVPTAPWAFLGFGSMTIYVDRFVAPFCAAVFLFTGMVLLRRRSGPATRT